jgi:hypothetical protein
MSQAARSTKVLASVVHGNPLRSYRSAASSKEVWCTTIPPAAAPLTRPGRRTITSGLEDSKPSRPKSRAAAPLLTRGCAALAGVTTASLCSHVGGYPLMTRTPRAGSAIQPRSLAMRMSRGVNPKETAWLRRTTPWREAANSAMARGAGADMWPKLSASTLPVGGCIEVRRFDADSARRNCAFPPGTGYCGRRAHISIRRKGKNWGSWSPNTRSSSVS